MAFSVYLQLPHVSEGLLYPEAEDASFRGDNGPT
jgi:hypothetical protein